MAHDRYLAGVYVAMKTTGVNNAMNAKYGKISIGCVITYWGLVLLAYLVPPHKSY